MWANPLDLVTYTIWKSLVPLICDRYMINGTFIDHWLKWVTDERVRSVGLWLAWFWECWFFVDLGSQLYVVFCMHASNWWIRFRRVGEILHRLRFCPQVAYDWLWMIQIQDLDWLSSIMFRKLKLRDKNNRWAAGVVTYEERMKWVWVPTWRGD